MNSKTRVDHRHWIATHLAGTDRVVDRPRIVARMVLCRYLRLADDAPLDYGDGWLPHAHRPNYDLLDRLPEFREMEKEAGRSVPISVFGVSHDPDQWAADEDAGVERIVLSMESEQSDAVLPQLDAWAQRL